MPSLKPVGTLVNNLDRALGLDSGDRSVGVLRHNITTIEQGAGHWRQLQCYVAVVIDRGYALYLPSRGSHLTIWLYGSKQDIVIS